MNLSIIILNYNTKDITVACINSLFIHYKEQIIAKSFEIIVVDNASHDDSIKHLQSQSWFSHITLIQNKENVGFSKGCNIGASSAKGRYFLFLNSDTEMEDQGLLSMGEYLEKHEDIGVLGGRLKNPDGSYQASAGVFYTLPRVFLLLIGAERFGKLRYSPETIQKVDWVSGAMMMIKKEIFDTVGGFDEKLFMYMEDMELCFRVKQKEKQVFFYPDCTIKHISYGSSNRGFAILHIYKGLLYFYKKHENRVEYTIVKALLMLKAVLLLIGGALIGNKTVYTTYKKALAAIV